MKILQINKLYSPWIGGVEKIVQQISEGLNGKNGLEIEVLCCSPGGKKKEERINGVKVYRASSLGIFWGMPFSFSFLFLFKKVSKDFDIIDFHHPFPLGNLAIFLLRPKAKLIVHYHSDIVRQRLFNFLINPLTNHALKRAEKIIVSNPNLIKSSPYLQKFEEKCEVILFGADLKRFERGNEKEIARIKEKHNNFVMFVGRLSYYKGIEYLIEAMKKIGANLIIIGQGSLKESLEKKIKELKLENKINILPPQPEEQLINFYKACSVFVLPSAFKTEAFGIVLIEAMFCGKPVISTELGTGTSFVNQDGITGFVVPPGNIPALSQAIKKILSDRKLAYELGQNARKRAEDNFSLEKMLREAEKVYNMII